MEQDENIKRAGKKVLGELPFSRTTVPSFGPVQSRTSALRLRYSTPPGESVHYVDVTSLYPYVNANCSYPLQHPKIIREDFNDAREYFGLIRAVVHPPRGLFFPVLPS